MVFFDRIYKFTPTCLSASMTFVDNNKYISTLAPASEVQHNAIHQSLITKNTLIQNKHT